MISANFANLIPPTSSPFLFVSEKSGRKFSSSIKIIFYSFETEGKGRNEINEYSIFYRIKFYNLKLNLI